MKIILSRKGFDGGIGKIASPIMPDGTLLSMPIPEDDNEMRYDQISWNGKTYLEIIESLTRRRGYCKCHLDPDIRENRVTPVPGWREAFGQSTGAQKQLENAEVDVGDIFLFFGWFREVRETDNGYKYARTDPQDFYRGRDLHVIYGYFQIGEIIKGYDGIKKYYWHPHAEESYKDKTNNTLYLPTDKLSIMPEYPGCGTLDYRIDRVLTKENKTKARWNEHSFLEPEHVHGNRKNSSKDGGLYYAGQWQELIIMDEPEEPEGLIEWVKSIIRT